MKRKFDMSRAWDRATEMIGVNLGVILPVVGVFFLLPSAIMPFVERQDLALLQRLGVAAEAREPEIWSHVKAYWLSFISLNWWLILVAAIVGIIGTLTLLKLLLQPGRDSVGDAIAGAGTLFPSYFAAAILSSFATLIGLMLFIIPGIYIGVRLGLFGAALASGNARNPIDALKASWAATKGNALLIFLFFFLMGLAMVVISLVLGLIFGLLDTVIFGAPELEQPMLLSTLAEATFGALGSAVLIAASASTWEQLSAQGGDTDAV